MLHITVNSKLFKVTTPGNLNDLLHNPYTPLHQPMHPKHKANISYIKGHMTLRTIDPT